MLNRTALISTFTCLSLLAACDKRENTTTTPPSASDTAADNTARNKRDADMDNTKTPIDQSESAEDIRITAEIRRALMDDKQLSTNAHNCKVITDKGVVTLRGPVDSQAEKDSIEAKAKAVAGVVRVDNQLEVKAP